MGWSPFSGQAYNSLLGNLGSMDRFSSLQSQARNEHDAQQQQNDQMAAMVKAQRALIDATTSPPLNSKKEN